MPTDFAVRPSVDLAYSITVGNLITPGNGMNIGAEERVGEWRISGIQENQARHKG
jgi:hypothetical protein